MQTHLNELVDSTYRPHNKAHNITCKQSSTPLSYTERETLTLIYIGGTYNLILKGLELNS